MSLQFLQPESLAEALELLGHDPENSKIIAGGTAVVLMLQHKLIAPERLISLGRIPGLTAIHKADDGLHCGSLALLREVAATPIVRQDYPALAQAGEVVGNVRIRNQATLGGNLAEADYASDPPAVLLALDASVVAASATGSRTLPLSEFFLGFYSTALEPAEIITEVIVPSLPAACRMTYLKYKSRSSEDRPCAGVAAMAAFDEGVCVDLRIAIGAACEVPRRLPDIEALGIEQTLPDELIDEIAEGYAREIETLDDLRGSAWYRTQMIRVHVRRALKEIRDGRW
jgi:aerobic carbon-monoxide dehydrogenase medium subunit